ncbi:MAG: hypothetical protein ACJ74Y_12785 [Bryobacteraceae bacterium]
MAQLTAKRSTVFIADARGIQVFKSVSDVPLPLRRKLQESTRSSNSATILIADRHGREELVRALQGEPSSVQCRLAETLRAKQARPPQEIPIPARVNLRWPLIAFLFILFVCGSIWLALQLHF